jgi:predicted RNase H-like HicB family nuclease
MVEIQPIRVELEREEDGRTLASVPALPGVMAYGASEEEAVRKVKPIALQVLADMTLTERRTALADSYLPARKWAD